MGCICLRAARGALLLALVVCLCFPAQAAVWVEGMELDIELPSGKTIQDNPGGSRIDVGGAQYTVLDGGVELFSTVKATVESTNSYYHILLTRSYLDSLSAEVRRFLVGQIQFRHLENSSGLSSIVVLEDNDRDGTFTLERILYPEGIYQEFIYLSRNDAGELEPLHRLYLMNYLSNGRRYQTYAIVDVDADGLVLEAPDSFAVTQEDQPDVLLFAATPTATPTATPSPTPTATPTATPITKPPSVSPIQGKQRL